MTRLSPSVVPLRPLALGAVLLAAPAASRAQSPVSVTVVVANPSPYLSDWAASPAIATLILTSSTRVALTGTVTAYLYQGAGPAVGTPVGTGAVGTVPSDISSIAPLTSAAYTTPQIARWNEGHFTGAVGSQLASTGRLPEGSYALCVLVSNLTDQSGNTYPDASACTPFTVSFPQPPRLLAPADQSPISGPYPVFQWTPVIAPGAVPPDYLFRLVEVLPGQTPLQAIEGNVPLLNVPLHATTALVYPPSALPLEDGKRYAWRVQAVRSERQGPAVPVGANEGRSEIFTFTRGVTGPPVVMQPALPPSVVVHPFPLYNASLSGTLDYTFDPSAVPAPKQVPTPAAMQILQPFHVLLENPAPSMQMAPPRPFGVRGQMQAPPSVARMVETPPPGPRVAPLGGVTVRLVVRYRTGTQAILAGPIYAGAETYTDNGEIVATATTGSDGSFTFLFHDDYPTGVVAKNTLISWGHGEIGVGSETGALVRYYNLEVGDGHYLTPSDELTRDSTGGGNVGTLVSLLRTYHLVVKVVDARDTAHTLPAVTVQLLRGVRPPTVPAYEGPSGDWPRPLLQSGISSVYRKALPKWEIIGAGEADAHGAVAFSRLVKNVGPADVYDVRVATPEGGLLYYETAFVQYAQSWPMLGSPNGDWAYYNEQYDGRRTDTLVIHLVPKKARYVARLMRADTLVPIRSGWAELCYTGTTGRCDLREVDSTDDGYFSFSDILPDTSKTPPFWRLYAGATGFITQMRDSLALLRGTQSTGDVYYLTPDAHIRGRIVDESGAPLFGYVEVDDGAWTATHPALGDQQGKPLGMQLSPGLFQASAGARALVPAQAPMQRAPVMAQPQAAAPQAQARAPQTLASSQQMRAPVVLNDYVFDFNAVSGHQHVKIDAGPKYFPLDTVIDIPRGGPTNLGTFTMYLRVHRLRLLVMGGTANQTPGAARGRPLAGAVVQLGISGHPTDTTNADGVAEFTWQSPNAADSSVAVTVTGPAGQDYVGVAKTLQVPESRTWTVKSVLLPLGTSIAGRVFAGPSDSAAVPGARVSLDLGSDSATLETTTDSAGHYVLHAVPLGTFVVQAGKTQSNFIGDSLVVAAKLPAVTGQDFHLRYYNGIDISRLLGFPIEVYDLKDLGGGRALIRGAFVHLPANAAFATGVSALPFDSVTIRSDGTPAKHAVPVAGAVVLRDNTLALEPFKATAFVAKQSAPGTGLRVRALPSGAGAVFGPIVVDASASFTGVTSAELDSLPEVWLLKPGASGANRTDLASITADSSDPAGPSGWNVGTAGGGRLRFRLYGFRADADSAASFLQADALHLAATLHTDIPGVSDLALRMPGLRIVPGNAPQGGVQASADSQPISLKLGTWTLTAQTWYLSPSEGKVYLAQGEVLVPPDPSKPASTIAFPFTGVGVSPTALGGGNFGTGPVLLGGIVPMTASQPIKFVMEAPGGPWSLTALGGSISGLPGMDAGSAIALDNFSFKSDGTSGLTTKGSATVSYYHTADFAVKAIGITQTAVQLNGNLDIHVPNLGPQAFIFTYTRAGGGVALAMPPLDFQPFDVGGASLTLKGGTLDAAGFKSGGEIVVTGKWTVPITFTRTPLNGTNQMSAVPVPGAVLAIGEVQAHDLTGGAALTNGQWATAFDGQLDVNSGEAKGPFHVGILGSEVNIGTSGLSVKKIPTPFGNITITLDFPKQRIEGALQIAKTEIAPGTKVSGTVDLAISGKPDDRYWYFFAGVTADLSTPHVSATVALLIGQATLSDDMLATFKQYSNKGVPDAFKTIDGFFFDGKISVPIPVCPSGGIDVGVASISIFCNAFGDLRLGINFQQLTTYDIGLEAGVDVGVKGGVGLGVCLHVKGEVIAEAGLEGEYRSDGAWYVDGGLDLQLKGSVSGGVGFDDVCIEATASFGLTLGAEAQVGYNWNTNTGPFMKVYMK